jgi:hypothetical protein
MIHNKTFLDALPPTFGAQAYALANYHENGVFTDSAIDGIGNGEQHLNFPIAFPLIDECHQVAIRTILPSIFSSLTRIANQNDPLKLALNEISYKPFISLFNVTQAAVSDPEIRGIGVSLILLPIFGVQVILFQVNYASAVSLEVHSSPAGPNVVMKFKNGTADHTFRPLSIFGASGIPLSDFISRLTVCGIFLQRELILTFCLARGHQ